MDGLDGTGITMPEESKRWVVLSKDAQQNEITLASEEYSGEPHGTSSVTNTGCVTFATATCISLFRAVVTEETTPFASSATRHVYTTISSTRGPHLRQAVIVIYMCCSTCWRIQRHVSISPTSGRFVAETLPMTSGHLAVKRHMDIVSLEIRLCGFFYSYAWHSGSSVL